VGTVYLLGDVPHESGRIESHQPVVDGHLVKHGSLFVAEERVRNPDLVPVIFAETNVENFGMNGLESKPSVAPRLPQVHAHRIVLQRQLIFMSRTSLDRRDDLVTPLPRA